MKTPQRHIIRHGGPYNQVSIMFAKKGRTKQSMKDECDINKIMEKYQKTGAVAHVNQHQSQYGFATSDDFAESMRIVTTAQDMFDGLPSSIRTRFANDPAQFLDFVQDANNKKEGQELGLWPEDEPPAPKPPETPPTDKTSEDKTTETPKKE